MKHSHCSLIKVIFLILGIMFMTHHELQAQKQGKLWYFGRQAGIDFNYSPPVPVTNSALTTIEGCATIADRTGMLLFYTDGSTVYDKHHNVMSNGDGLLGNASSTQSAIIVPWPGTSCKKYYIFTVDAAENSLGNGLNYSIVDFTTNPLGEVVDKNTPLEGIVAEKLTSISDNNGGFWVVAHGFGMNNTDSRATEFYVYHITETGINVTPQTYSIGGRHERAPGSGGNQYLGSQGQLKFSPDGTKIACAVHQSVLNPGGNYIKGFIEVFNFIKTTGAITAMNGDNFHFDDFNPGYPYGIEFSPNGNILYVATASNANSDELSLFDLTITTPTKVVIGTSQGQSVSGGYDYGALQLATDQKIYLARRGRNYISIIKTPNVATSTGCGFTGDAGLQLAAGKLCELGLPNAIQGYFSCDGCEQALATTYAPFMTLQRWMVPNEPNIQGMTAQEKDEVTPSSLWFTEHDQNRIGMFTMPTSLSACDAVTLHECDLSGLQDGNNEAYKPFKITYDKEEMMKVPSTNNKGKITKRQVSTWFTVPNNNLFAGIGKEKKLPASCIIHSYPVGSYGQPWDIQWQPKVSNVHEPELNKKISSSALLWYSVKPDTSCLYSFNPNTNTLKQYQLPSGYINAFVVDGGYIWIIATDANFDYIYRMRILGGQALVWNMKKSGASYSSIRTLYTTKIKPANNATLPLQVWATGTRNDSGVVRILKLNKQATYSSLYDTLCTIDSNAYKMPNGLFAPTPIKSGIPSKMFITEAAPNDNSISSNRATPQDTILRNVRTVFDLTFTLNPIIDTVRDLTRIIKPICERINLDNCAKECVVEQWKTISPPASFDFTQPDLDIDMVGAYFTTGSSIFSSFEQYNVAFHEPRPGNYGLIGRFTYNAEKILSIGPPPHRNSSEYSSEENATSQTSVHAFKLYDCYPNPFNPKTTIRFELPGESYVTLTVFNTIGQEVATLYDREYMNEGEHVVDFDASRLSSGVYFYRIYATKLGNSVEGTAGKTYSEIKKMFFLK